MTRNIAFDLLEALTGNRLEYFKRGKTPNARKKGPGRIHKQGHPSKPNQRERGAVNL